MSVARPMVPRSAERAPRNWWREALVLIGILAFGYFALGMPGRAPAPDPSAAAGLID